MLHKISNTGRNLLKLWGSTQLAILSRSTSIPGRIGSVNMTPGALPRTPISAMLPPFFFKFGFFFAFGLFFCTVLIPLTTPVRIVLSGRGWNVSQQCNPTWTAQPCWTAPEARVVSASAFLFVSVWAKWSSFLSKINHDFKVQIRLQDAAALHAKWPSLLCKRFSFFVQNDLLLDVK